MSRTPFPHLDALARALFRDSMPRNPAEPLEFGGVARPTGVEGSDERAAAAVGALLIWKLIQHGGSTLPVGPAEVAAERLLETFGDTDRRRLESEAVQILRWLEDSLNLLGDDWDGVEDRGLYPWEDREFPDEGKADLIRHAIRDKVDLEIEYFTYSRNSMSRRRITPLELEGDAILRARCHWRRSERSFALHRIKEARLARPEAAAAAQTGGSASDS
jgi:hypothetical protein